MDEPTDVLLVEEDDVSASLAIEALQHRCDGCPHCSAISGDEAMEFAFAALTCSRRAEVQLPRLIVVDLHLHGATGLEVLRELKGNEATRGIPVVALASCSEEIKEVESLGLPVNSCVLKPADSRRFAQLIADVGHYWLTVHQPSRA